MDNIVAAAIVNLGMIVAAQIIASAIDRNTEAIFLEFDNEEEESEVEHGVN